MIENTLGQPYIALILLGAGLLLGSVFFISNKLFKKTNKYFKIFAHIMDFSFALLAGAAYFSVIYTLSDGLITVGPAIVYLAGIILAYKLLGYVVSVSKSRFLPSAKKPKVKEPSQLKRPD